jgi:hypothetical protein
MMFHMSCPVSAGLGCCSNNEKILKISWQRQISPGLSATCNRNEEKWGWLTCGMPCEYFASVSQGDTPGRCCVVSHKSE